MNYIWKLLQPEDDDEDRIKLMSLTASERVWEIHWRLAR